jgi:hypothetical protein
METPKEISMDKLERLKLAFENQTSYLALFTTVDFKLFVGYITLQLAFAGWMVTSTLGKTFNSIHCGLLLVDFAIAVAAWGLLNKNHSRRDDEIGKLRNICEALGYHKPGEFLSNGEPLFKRTISRPSLKWYRFVIVTIWVGVTLVLLGPALGL